MKGDVENIRVCQNVQGPEVFGKYGNFSGVLDVESFFVGDLNENQESLYIRTKHVIYLRFRASP